MKFHWGLALYLALRWAMYGALAGFAFGLVIALGQGSGNIVPAVAMSGFWLAGLIKLGHEALTKDYPDA